MEAKTMTAVLTTGSGGIELRRIAVPQPGPEQVLVKVIVAAQNPTDWKTVINFKRKGNVVGCEFAGVVALVGKNVKAEQVQVGQRVTGCVHGSIKPKGAFAEYLVAPSHLLIKLPDHLSFEQAAQVTIASTTAYCCLYQTLSLPLPSDSTTPVTGSLLIWGGNTSVGRLTIQLAKMSGLQRIISTSSPQNFDSLRKLGATDVFDYRDPQAGEKIHLCTNGSLCMAVDCISEGTTPYQVSTALSAAGGTIATVNPYVSRKNGIETVLTLVYTMLGDAFEFPIAYEPDPRQVEIGKRICQMVTVLLADQQIQLGPVKIIPRGLVGVAEGFEFMKRGAVTGEKIVYRIADTPALDFIDAVC
ncbi:hypothetical protein D9758_014643 [Tetrapyrgos nigripes]|uniref:Enoyl reductase (ER) domain-containing protein n=1 Tax=Tetrapyrgos nigripes TaxID=182062 RepID=A0A8H5FT48_9AGAR|nr:hypothetical protein D9758_014643 [Tetrapyrgos nigripes]